MMAIFDSIVWGLFEYTEFFNAPREKMGQRKNQILEARWF
jgi:hypothetical protein